MNAGYDYLIVNYFIIICFVHYHFNFVVNFIIIDVIGNVGLFMGLKNQQLIDYFSIQELFINGHLQIYLIN